MQKGYLKMEVKVILNEDKNLVIQVKEKIAKNKGHCCCAIIFTDDNKCPCKDFREKIKNKELGFCDCKLYQIVKTSN